MSSMVPCIPRIISAVNSFVSNITVVPKYMISAKVSKYLLTLFIRLIGVVW
jgi:hypothetical protein